MTDILTNRASGFADLVCADPELVDAEFEALVRANWDEPPSVPDVPPSPMPAPHGTGPDVDTEDREPSALWRRTRVARPSRQRGPPGSGQ